MLMGDRSGKSIVEQYAEFSEKIGVNMQKTEGAIPRGQSRVGVNLLMSNRMDTSGVGKTSYKERDDSQETSQTSALCKPSFEMQSGMLHEGSL